MYLFEGLKAQVSEYLPSEQVERIRDAFVVANEAHSSQNAAAASLTLRTRLRLQACLLT